MVSWGPVVAELVLGIAAAEPPEAHVHILEHFVDYGVAGDTNVGRVFALGGQAGLSPTNFCESVSKGCHGFGADDEA